MAIYCILFCVVLSELINICKYSFVDAWDRYHGTTLPHAVNICRSNWCEIRLSHCLIRIHSNTIRMTRNKTFPKCHWSWVCLFLILPMATGIRFGYCRHLSIDIVDTDCGECRSSRTCCRAFYRRRFRSTWWTGERSNCPLEWSEFKIFAIFRESLFHASMPFGHDGHRLWNDLGWQRWLLQAIMLEQLSLCRPVDFLLSISDGRVSSMFSVCIQNRAFGKEHQQPSMSL